MAAAQGYVAVGGQRSQVVVRSLGNDWYPPLPVGMIVIDQGCLGWHQQMLEELLTIV